MGEDVCPTLALQAAALLHGLAGNHALADGNTRIAWLATTVSLDLNGCRSDVDDHPAFRAGPGRRRE